MSKEDISALAVVPARGGSSRLSKKNLRKLAGQPLVTHTLRAAVDSGSFETVILSSDDPEILEVGISHDGVTADRRPPKLATDDSKAREVVWELLDRPKHQGKFNAVALLLPTCPFRSAEDIRRGFELLDTGIDSVVSVTTYEFPPQLGLASKEGQQLEPLWDPSPLVTGDTRSQNQSPIYRPNGGFYIAWWDFFDEARNFFKGRTRGYRMSRERSVDIDEAIDLEYAQFLLDQGKIQLH